MGRAKILRGAMAPSLRTLLIPFETLLRGILFFGSLSDIMKFVLGNPWAEAPEAVGMLEDRDSGHAQLKKCIEKVLRDAPLVGLLVALVNHRLAR